MFKFKNIAQVLFTVNQINFFIHLIYIYFQNFLFYYFYILYHISIYEVNYILLTRIGVSVRRLKVKCSIQRSDEHVTPTIRFLKPTQPQHWTISDVLFLPAQCLKVSGLAERPYPRLLEAVKLHLPVSTFQRKSTTFHDIKRR